MTDSVDLRSLANITSSLYLCSKAGCQIRLPDGSPTIDVDLPALESARYISVNGSLSKSESLSKLALIDSLEAD